MHVVLLIVGYALGPLSLIAFAGVLLRKKDSPNIATFALWGLLDLVFAINMYMAGNHIGALFPAAYAVAAACVAVISWQNGNWTLGVKEYLCAAGTVIALAIWYSLGPHDAILAGGVAMFIAGFPILLDAIKRPEKWTWWMWGSAAVSCWILFQAADSWRIEDCLFAGYGAVYNSVMVFFTLRQGYAKAIKEISALYSVR